MHENEEILAKIRDVLGQFDQCVQEYAHAFRMYNVPLPKGTEVDCLEGCSEVARILGERSSAVETVSKLDIVRARFVRLRVDVHAAVIESVAKSLKDKIRAANAAHSMQPATRDRLREIEDRQVHSVQLAKTSLGRRGNQPDSSLRDIMSAVKWLQEADNEFEREIASLGPMESSVANALTRINERLHAVSDGVQTSQRSSSRFGWWGIIIGVVGTVIGIVGIALTIW
ncbi:MAG: hypothetical protein ACKVW3_08195 [Phycisphaerales bacterium]